MLLFTSNKTITRAFQFNISVHKIFLRSCILNVMTTSVLCSKKKKQIIVRLLGGCICTQFHVVPRLPFYYRLNIFRLYRPGWRQFILIRFSFFSRLKVHAAIVRS